LLKKSEQNTAKFEAVLAPHRLRKAVADVQAGVSPDLFGVGIWTNDAQDQDQNQMNDKSVD
jgi:hypothetical protein